MISRLKQKLIEKFHPTLKILDIIAGVRPVRSSHIPPSAGGGGSAPQKPSGSARGSAPQKPTGSARGSAPQKTSRGGQRDPLDLNFNSHKEAFKSKYTSELVRAYIVYQMCSINWLVENNDQIMKRLRAVFGLRIFEFLMKLTFYGQFVAGQDQARIKPTVDRLRSFGVKSILDYSVEEDVSREEAEKREMKFNRRYKVTSVRTYFYQNEATCEKNTAAFLRSIGAVAEVTNSKGCMALKLTALGRPQLLLQLSEVIMRARKYMEQMGSKSGGETAVMHEKKTVEDLKRYFGQNAELPHVKHFLENITKDKVGVVHLFPWSDILDKDLKLSEEFRVPDPKTGQMRRLISQISNYEEIMFRNMLRRLYKIIEAANEVQCRIMIDAEHSYFQPAISRICMELMKKYNRKQCLIFNTYQTYMQCTYREMVTDLEQAKRQNFFWGSKLVRGAYLEQGPYHCETERLGQACILLGSKTVRGAYLEQERARAAYMGYPDPTCPNFEATTASFHKCLDEVMMRAIHKEPVSVMVASHNEDTVRYSIEQMEKLNLRPADKIICFGQLLGMCDHVTFPLGQAGFSAYKYVPYGPVVEVLPYLSRRARENRGFLSKIKKEKRLLLKEIFRRIITREVFHKPVGNYTPA